MEVWIFAFSNLIKFTIYSNTNPGEQHIDAADDDNRPDLKRDIDELDSAWNKINSTCKKIEHDLIAAMKKAAKREEDRRITRSSRQENKGNEEEKEFELYDGGQDLIGAT